MRQADIILAGLIPLGLLAQPAAAVLPGLPACVSPSGERWNRMERLRDGLDVYVVEPTSGALRVEIAQCYSARKIVVSGIDPTWKTQYAINMMFRLVSDARVFGMEELTWRLTYGSSAARLEAVAPGTCPCAEEN